MKIDKKNIKWIVLLFLIIIFTAMYYSVITRILVQNFAALIGLIGGATIIYFLFSDLIFGAIYKIKKGKRCWCCICTAIVLSICVFIYFQNNKSDYVQMKEDVLYIHPKSGVQKELYDGSKDDPNLKEDNVEGTTKMKEDVLYKHPKKDTVLRK